MVNINLDWRESLPHSYDRVEYEFWTNNNDECGPKCVSKIEFVNSFKGAAQMLEKGLTLYLLFTTKHGTSRESSVNLSLSIMAGIVLLIQNMNLAKVMMAKMWSLKIWGNCVFSKLQLKVKSPGSGGNVQ